MIPHTPEEALAILKGKKLIPISCLICISVLGIVDPTFVLNSDNQLVISDAEFAAVAGPGPVQVLEGVPIIDDSIVWGDSITWQLDTPGLYLITAFGVPDVAAGVPRARFDWTVTVVPDQAPSRLRQIKDALFSFFDAMSSLRALNPTNQEIFQATLLADDAE